MTKVNSRWHPLRYLTLRQGYLLALGLIMVISTLKFIAMERLVKKQDAAAIVINVSGQQRMLSQRIAYFATAHMAGKDVQQQLQETVEEFANNHHDLIYGNTVRELPQLDNEAIQRVYFSDIVPAKAGTHASERAANAVVPIKTPNDPEANGMNSPFQGNDGRLDNLVKNYIQATQQVLKNNSQPALEYIATIGPNELLNQLNQVVKLHEQKSRADVRFIANGHTVFWLITALILILEALFLFRPMVKKIEASIQELKKRESKIKSQFQELERFTYVASHDLQEPLRKIIGFNERLQMDLADKLNEKTERYLHFINVGALHMRELVHGLRDYARVLSCEEQLQAVDINKIMQTITEKEPDMQINISTLPTVSYNRQMLNQLFSILIDNAKTYQSNRPLIVDITAEEQDAYWQFCVADNGIGIDEKFIEKIFAIFQRLHRKEDIAGIGLGLAMARKIVERHGGQLWVKSQPNKGSQFYFTIPKGTTS